MTLLRWAEIEFSSLRQFELVSILTVTAVVKLQLDKWILEFWDLYEYEGIICTENVISSVLIYCKTTTNTTTCVVCSGVGR